MCGCEQLNPNKMHHNKRATNRTLQKVCGNCGRIPVDIYAKSFILQLRLITQMRISH